MMRRRGFSIVALLAVLSVVGLAAAGPASARKAPKEFFGVVPQESLSTADFQRMTQANVGTVRFGLSRESVEPADNQFNFLPTDDLVGDIAAAGIRPLPNVSGGPGFGNPNDRVLPVGSAEDQAQWQEFLRVAAERYGPGGEYWTNPSLFPAQHPGAQPMPVETWQIWNEQNGPKHAVKPNPRKYAKLVKISHTAITSEAPNAAIVLGGMFGTPKGKGGIKAWTFLKGLYKSKGVKKAFDGVAIHPYSPDLQGIVKQIKRVRAVLKKKKDRSAGVWLTELGWGSSKKGRLGVGTKKQAKLLKKSFKVLLQRRGNWKIRGVLWYTWRDAPSAAAPCDWCITAGLLGQSGFEPKPAFKQYVRFTGGS
jgi:hypothetical protein